MSFLSNLFGKEKKQALDEGLQKSKTNLLSKITRAVAGKSTIDDEVLDNMEEALITSDVGVTTTSKIISRLQQRVSRDKYISSEELHEILQQEIIAMLGDRNAEDFSLPSAARPHVIMVVGVNGVGKTTTIGKLSAQYKQKGLKVVLGAADTFRAAAVDQLKLWGERNDIPVHAKGMNVDPSAVAFETVKLGVDTQADVVIVDTAGRLHTKVNLMNELTKIKRSMNKAFEGSPHEVLMVLDGSTGQNAILQAREFMQATEITALAITKLDGTAKGGAVIAICSELNIPVKYIGVGEKVTDLQSFNPREFVHSLLSRNGEKPHT